LTRLVPSLALFALLLALLAAPGTAAAAIVSVEEAKTEMTMGKADAPVTIVEFSSLGCPHCARFHSDTLPRIKKDYIDTGKVRLIFQDFPLGTPALAASMIAHCSGPKKFFGFIEILFRSQAQWTTSGNPMQALSKVARFGGMSEDDVQACLKYQQLLEHIRKGALVGQESYKINATPSFGGAGADTPGAQRFVVFHNAFDTALKK